MKLFDETKKEIYFKNYLNKKNKCRLIYIRLKMMKDLKFNKYLER